MSSDDERIASPPADSPVADVDDDDALASGDDLFGGDDDDANDNDGGSDGDATAAAGRAASPAGSEGDLSDQPLSEHGLDSDDDDDRDRSARRDAPKTREETVMDLGVFRHRVPKADGGLRTFRVPNFIRMQPEEYNADTFEPTEFDLENSLSKNPKHVARFRRDPASGAVQSNAAIYRWSDGSTTVAIGDEHFEVLSKGLAAPDAGKNGKYQELQDAHYYAAAAHLSTSLLLTVGHVTEQYSVRPNRSEADDALKRLTDRLQAASQSSTSANMIIRTLRDPELAKKEAEMAEKERDRARRRRETQAARADGGGGGGGGGGGRNWGGLSVGDLETGGGGSGSRRSGGARKKGTGAPRAKRRRDEYDSDDDLPGGARRNDDYYDKEDDFIASSDDGSGDEGARGGDDDDEEEILEDDEDDEEEEAESERKAASSRRAKRQKTAETEEDADGDDDDDVPASRRNRRHIIDDDEE